jgi:peptidoglycan/LPS O-acetylase OafA/YrhL
MARVRRKGVCCLQKILTEAMELSPTRKGLTLHRLPQIELLRAIAVVGIFLFHLWSVVPDIGEKGFFGKLIGSVSSLGFLGVVLFNFITGFVLAYPYLGPKQQAIPTYLHYLERRFLRICPKYYFALSLWTLVLFLTTGSGAISLLSDFLGHMAFVHSLLPTSFFSIVPAYWWLGLLAQFYLVFPLLLRFFKVIGAARASFALCFICYFLWITLSRFSHPGSTLALVNYMLYYNLPTRLPEFAFGMWFAQSWHVGLPHSDESRPSSLLDLTSGYTFFVMAALVLAIAGTAVFRSAMLPLRHMTMVSWCLVLIVVVLTSKVSAPIGASWLVSRIAAASYSIFLLHQPLLGYADRWLGDALQPMAEFFLLLVFIGTASFLLARGVDRLIV